MDGWTYPHIDVVEVGLPLVVIHIMHAFGVDGVAKLLGTPLGQEHSNARLDLDDDPDVLR